MPGFPAVRTAKNRITGRPIVDDLSLTAVRESAEHHRLLTDTQLRNASDDLREKVACGGDDQKDFTLSSFALATEAVRRSTGKNYYDVQLQAGSVLANGDLAEMATGEGKTLVTLLPVYHGIVAGDNVHVATTNSYLAQRDCEELRPAFEMLGISIGLLPEENDNAAKKQAYGCDVTYGTGYEFGFDYLRDQLLLRNQPADRLGESWLRSLNNTTRPLPELVQSDRRFTVVDEIDSVLIDEANTPLVISFFADDHIDDAPYQRAAAVADDLVDDVDYQVDTIAQRITITRTGLDKLSQQTRFDSRPTTALNLQRPWRIYVEQALRARHLLRRDIDYVVQDGAVALVDQQTGRIFPERKWRDGLHQAIEFLESAEMTPETNSFARISRQRFFKIYDKATGMTGTATDAVDEFRRFFSLNVVPIPLNRPSQRVALPSRFFANSEARNDAIVADAQIRHRNRQPVLVGTRSIQQSLQIADLLSAAGLPHQVLNGLQDAEEAEVVSQAGQPGAIVVATNMAGRGTDIKLTDESRRVGGLHVIVTEPNRSHRVDRQLVGRAARQGEAGSCQVFASADDELLTSVDPAFAKRLRTKANSSGETLIDGDKELRKLQWQAEQIDFARRQHLMQQDLWIEGVLNTLVGTA